MGNYNTGGAGTAPRPMLGAAGGAAQPILNRESPQVLQNMRGFAPERNGPTEILNRESPPVFGYTREGRTRPDGTVGGTWRDVDGNELPGRPTPRPMGGLTPYDDRRDIMAPNLRGGGGGRMSGGINPGGMYAPNRGPRSYQPGHGDGTGGYGMRGDVRTKGVQNATMGHAEPDSDEMGYDMDNDGDGLNRRKRRIERGMSAPGPQESQSYSSVGGASI